MTNIQTSLKGNILTIAIDLSKSSGDSKSGKTVIVASTQGNQPLADSQGGQVMLGVNCYRRK